MLHASAVLGFAVFWKAIGQDGARWRLGGLPENISSNVPTVAHSVTWCVSTPASPLGPREKVRAPRISEWIDLKHKGWGDRQASHLITWHYQVHLLRRSLPICNSREAALSAFHFQRMQLGLSNTLKIEHAQSITIQLHWGNLASLRNPCSSITIKKGQREKHLRWSSCVWPHLEGPQSDLQASAKGRERDTEFSHPKWYLVRNNMINTNAEYRIPPDWAGFQQRMLRYFIHGVNPRGIFAKSNGQIWNTATRQPVL